MRYGGNTSCVSMHNGDEPPIVFDLGTGLRYFGASCEPDRAHVSRHRARSPTSTGTTCRACRSSSRCCEATVPASTCTRPFRRTAESCTTPSTSSSARRTSRSRWRTSAARSRSRTSASDELHDRAGAGHVPRSFPTRTHARLPRDVGRRVRRLPVRPPAAVGRLLPRARPSALELCDGADLVIHDAQYTPDEFARKSTWGHCTVEYAVRVAHQAGAKRAGPLPPRPAAARRGARRPRSGRQGTGRPASASRSWWRRRA